MPKEAQASDLLELKPQVVGVSLVLGMESGSDMSWLSDGFGGYSDDAEEGCQLRGFQQMLHSSTTEISFHYILG